MNRHARRTAELLFTVTLVTLLAVSCVSWSGEWPSASPYRDGEYFVTYSHVDGEGWQAFVQITTKRSQITGVVFDAVNPAGEMKSQDIAYARQMREETGLTPSAVIRELEVNLIASQSAAVDAITGATRSTNQFKELAGKALELARRGRQEIAVLDQPDGDGSGDAVLNAADPDHGQPQRSALSAVVIRDRLLDHVSSSVTCGCSFKPPSEE